MAHAITHKSLMRIVSARAAMRAAADDAAIMVSELLYGEAFSIEDAPPHNTTDNTADNTADNRAEWVYGQSCADGYAGYVRADAMTPTYDVSHYLCALRSFIFSAADIKSPPRCAISLGSLLAVQAITGNFAQLVGGGFVFAPHIAPIGAMQNDYVAVAQKFIGTPYLWGGRSSLGLDCSGLVQVALQAVGIAAPRDSSMQADALGTPVAQDVCGRGDLVFWHDTTSTAAHIGILTAPNVLLHATARTMCVVEEDFATAAQLIAQEITAPMLIKRLKK